jgi:hypothetical protein
VTPRLSARDAVVAGRRSTAPVLGPCPADGCRGINAMLHSDAVEAYSLEFMLG